MLPGPGGWIKTVEGSGHNKDVGGKKMLESLE